MEYLNLKGLFKYNFLMKEGILLAYINHFYDDLLEILSSYPCNKIIHILYLFYYKGILFSDISLYLK